MASETEFEFLFVFLFIVRWVFIVDYFNKFVNVSGTVGVSFWDETHSLFFWIWFFHYHYYIPGLFICLFAATHPFIAKYRLAGDGAISGLIYQGSFLWIGLVAYVRAAAGDPPLITNPRRWPICFSFRSDSMSNPFHATVAGRRGLLRFPGARPCFLRQWRVWH